MSDLPLGWINVSWVEITTQDGFRRGPFGGNLKKEVFVKKGYSVYEQYAPINDDCKKFRYFITEEKYQELSSFWVEEGDFLISCSGTMGKITQVPIDSPKGVINQALLRVRLINSVVYSSFFIKLFRSPAIQERVLTKSGGGAIQNLAAVNQLKEIKLPIPPLNEQKRIADKLDAVLARVDACRDRFVRIPAILKRFRQSVLAAATSGKLTEEWRGENGVSDEWSISRIGELGFVTKLAGFEYTKFVNYREGGDLKVIKAENAGKWGFKYTNFSTVFSEDVSMLKRSKLIEGDVLMVFVGAGTGQVARVPIGNGWFLGPNIAMIRTKPEILNSAYLEHYCRSPNGSDEISKFIKSVAQPSLSMKTIRQVIIPLPTLKEQTEIVRRVESLFAYADRLEARYNAARTQVEKLTPALLAKAFRGELVPQDPNDEPASELLARIAAAQSTGKVKIARKPASGKNARVSTQVIDE